MKRSNATIGVLCFIYYCCFKIFFIVKELANTLHTNVADSEKILGLSLQFKGYLLLIAFFLTTAIYMLISVKVFKKEKF